MHGKWTWISMYETISGDPSSIVIVMLCSSYPRHVEKTIKNRHVVVCCSVGLKEALTKQVKWQRLHNNSLVSPSWKNKVKNCMQTMNGELPGRGSLCHAAMLSSALSPWYRRCKMDFLIQVLRKDMLAAAQVQVIAPCEFPNSWTKDSPCKKAQIEPPGCWLAGVVSSLATWWTRCQGRCIRMGTPQILKQPLVWGLGDLGTWDFWGAGTRGLGV